MSDVTVVSEMTWVGLINEREFIIEPPHVVARYGSSPDKICGVQLGGPSTCIGMLDQ